MNFTAAAYRPNTEALHVCQRAFAGLHRNRLLTASKQKGACPSGRNRNSTRPSEQRRLLRAGRTCSTPPCRRSSPAERCRQHRAECLARSPLVVRFPGVFSIFRRLSACFATRWRSLGVVEDSRANDAGWRDIDRDAVPLAELVDRGDAVVGCSHRLGHGGQIDRAELNLSF